MQRDKRLQAEKKSRATRRTQTRSTSPATRKSTAAQAHQEKTLTQHEKVAGSEQLQERKKRLRRMHARDGLPNGVVEVPGPLSLDTRDELLNIARNHEQREMDRRPGARILKISHFQRGLAIETDGEKLAQHIANAIARSRKAKVTRVYDDEGNRRILTCVLPQREDEVPARKKSGKRRRVIRKTGKR